MTASPRRARGVRSAVTGTVCAALVALLTACGADDPDAGTNGVGKLSAAQIEKRARQAADAAEAVRLSGTLVSDARTYRLDMRLTAEGGVGEVAAKGGTRFELLRVREDLYLKADAEFWAHREQEGEEPSKADREAAGKLDGKYVKVPPADPSYAQFSAFTEMDVLLDLVLALDGTRETGARGEVDGVRTIRVSADGGRGGTMDVSLVGTPYPLRLQRAGDAGTVTMTNWNTEFSLRPPDEQQVVDYGKKITED